MAQAAIAYNRLELLQISESVAREKSIDRKIVIQAMEDAIQKAAKSRYGAENDIRCVIDLKSGETKLTRVLTVVEAVENDSTEINLADAQKRVGFPAHNAQPLRLHRDRSVIPLS